MVKVMGLAALGLSRPEPLRRLWQHTLQLYFRLFQRHRHERLVLERLSGRDIVVLAGVMNPVLFRTGAFLVETLQQGWIPAGASVLDMGTGSGIGAIVAAQWSGRVMAVDLNPEAVRCAQINCLLNRVEDRVRLGQGDLFAPVGEEKFDVILFNPPFFRGRPQTNDGFSLAWQSESVMERFPAELRGHLTPAGYALVILSSHGETPAFLQAFQSHHFQPQIIAQRDLLNEILTIYQISNNS